MNCLSYMLIIVVIIIVAQQRCFVDYHMLIYDYLGHGRRKGGLWMLYTKSDWSCINPALTKLAGITKGSTVLDVGFGSGDMTDWFVSCGGDVYGIEKMSKFVKSYISRGADHTRFIQGSIPNPPSVGPGKFDAIVCHGVYMYLSNSEQDLAAKQLIGMLNPGGKLIIAGNVAHNRSFVCTGRISKFADTYKLVNESDVYDSTALKYGNDNKIVVITCHADQQQ